MTTEFFTRTEEEYTEEDNKRNEYRKLAEILKTLQYGSEEFNKLFTEYKRIFKAVNGYAPHWAR